MNSQYRISYEVLGPIFRFFFHRLRLIEEYKKDVPLLFLSRGGIRLHYFYQHYLAANELAPVAPQEDFYISRLAAFRALLAVAPKSAAELIAAEYRSETTASALRYFLPDDLYPLCIKEMQGAEDVLDEELTAEILLELLSDSCDHGKLLREHVRSQYDLLSEHFHENTNGKSEVILVDTGWSGSIVNSLSLLFPSVSMTAAFFGRYNYGKPPPPWFGLITGLILQQEHYIRLQPQSALIFHRHLIESLCEPDWPSVEYFIQNNDVPQPASGFIPDSVKAPAENEFIARAVLDYIKRENEASPAKVAREFYDASKKLAKLLTYPTVKEAKLLEMPPRSIDFGQGEHVPVLLHHSSRKSRLGRVRYALWHQGQAALEFGVFRVPVQFLLTCRNLPYRLLYILNKLKQI